MLTYAGIQLATTWDSPPTQSSTVASGYTIPLDMKIAIHMNANGTDDVYGTPGYRSNETLIVARVKQTTSGECRNGCIVGLTGPVELTYQDKLYLWSPDRRARNEDRAKTEGHKPMVFTNGVGKKEHTDPDDGKVGLSYGIYLNETTSCSTSTNSDIACTYSRLFCMGRQSHLFPGSLTALHITTFEDVFNQTENDSQSTQQGLQGIYSAREYALDHKPVPFPSVVPFALPCPHSVFLRK